LIVRNGKQGFLKNAARRDKEFLPLKPPERHRNITVKRLFLDAVQFIRCQSPVCHCFGKPFQPSRKYIEIDITYKCNLKCINCNRSCTQAPSEVEMPVSTIDAFIDQSVDQNIAWRRIRILGGEPTLHSRFFEIVDRLTRYQQVHNPDVRLVVGTNFHGRQVHWALEQLHPSIAIKSTLKTSRTNLFRPFNVAPVDTLFNRFSDYSCGCRIIEDCGLGLTPSGYYVCAVAGGIDRIFGYRLGRPGLPDPTDAFEDQLKAFCPLCGHFGCQWPTWKSRQSRTWRSAYAAAARQIKKPASRKPSPK
jgi:hypothetical protein